MDWLGSDEVIHVGIGCKVLSLILEDDKVMGFGDSTFLFSCFVTFMQSSRYYIESFNLVLLGHCVDVYLTPFFGCYLRCPWRLPESGIPVETGASF